MSCLVRARLVDSHSLRNFGSLSWRAAARPDPGVHAAAQVLCVTVANPLLGCAEICHLLSRNLPASVRIWSVIVVDGAFDPRRFCEVEEFSYFLPTSTVGLATNPHIITQMKEVVFPEFVRRGVFEASAGAIVDCDDIEFLPVHISSKNFAREQVRKMVAMAIGFAQHKLSVYAIRRSLAGDTVAISPAPAMFLVLNAVKFPYYMRRMRRPDPRIPDVEFTNVRGMIESWKATELLPEIVRRMKEHNPFAHGACGRMAQCDRIPCQFLVRGVESLSAH
jgi:tRNA pseudouridine(38-40) synthase